MGKTWTNRSKDKKRRKIYEVYESADYKEYKGCTRKKGAYESSRVAQNAANEQMEIYGVFLRPYKCEFCKMYHLTHHPYSKKELNVQKLGQKQTNSKTHDGVQQEVGNP